MTSQKVIFRVFFRLPDPKSEKNSYKSANKYVCHTRKCFTVCEEVILMHVQFVFEWDAGQKFSKLCLYVSEDILYKQTVQTPMKCRFHLGL